MRKFETFGITEEDVRARAFDIFENRGTGSDLTDWLLAEDELIEACGAEDAIIAIEQYVVHQPE